MTLTSQVSCSSSSGASGPPGGPGTPALEKNRSIGPEASRASATSRWISASRLTSTVAATAAAPTSAATASARSESRSATTSRRAPSAAKASAHARPMPFPAPSRPRACRPAPWSAAIYAGGGLSTRCRARRRRPRSARRRARPAAGWCAARPSRKRLRISEIVISSMRHHDPGHHQRGVDLVDEERQRVKDATDGGHHAGHDPARERGPRPGLRCRRPTAPPRSPC